MKHTNRIINRIISAAAAVLMLAALPAASVGEETGLQEAAVTEAAVAETDSEAENTSGSADTLPETTEETALAEIQGILDIQPVGDIEGMDLETLTSTISGNVMGEYFDPVSGFSMQYPSVLQFAEKEKGMIARSDDGRIQMVIETTPDGKQLTSAALMEAVKMEDPSALIREYSDPACFVREKTAGKEYRIDLYMLSGDWLHHVTITCPESEKDSVTPFVEYMIHSMTTADGDVG